MVEPPAPLGPPPLDAALHADEHLPADIRALDVVRRGIATTPSIRRPLVYSALLALLVAAGRLATPVLIQQLLDRGIAPDGLRTGVVVQIAVVGFTVVTLVAVLGPIAEYKMAAGAHQSLHELRVQAFAHIHRLGIVMHSTERRGALLTRVTSDTETIARFVEWGAISWVINTTLIVGVFAVMTVYSWQLALVAFFVMSTLAPLLRWTLQRQVKAYDTVRSRVGELLGTFDETLAGAGPIRAYGYSRGPEDDWNAGSRAVDSPTSTPPASRPRCTPPATSPPRSRSSPWHGWRSSGVRVGDSGSAKSCRSSSSSASCRIRSARSQRCSTRRNERWPDGTRSSRCSRSSPSSPNPSTASQVPRGPLGVRMLGVDAAYGADAPLVLRGVDLDIAAGTAVAVVGETGSGKTTFARLLCRLLDPTAGSVALGGFDLRDMSAEDRRHAVRLVPQDGFLFDVTVEENIRYGELGSDRAGVERVIAELGLGEWIARLPDGLETEVGPRGSRLSVGERQLVALLRARMADPGVLVLDEATSSIDPDTEQMLSAALERLSRDRTVVTIAHRLATAEHADVVLVFDRGELVEQGTHHELLDRGGRYARLHEAWQRTVRT